MNQIISHIFIFEHGISCWNHYLCYLLNLLVIPLLSCLSIGFPIILLRHHFYRQCWGTHSRSGCYHFLHTYSGQYRLPWWFRCLQCRRPEFNPCVKRYPEDGNGYPLQYSCLKNSMDRGTWWAIPSMGLQTVRHHWATNTLIDNIHPFYTVSIVLDT